MDAWSQFCSGSHKVFQCNHRSHNNYHNHKLDYTHYIIFVFCIPLYDQNCFSLTGHSTLTGKNGILDSASTRYNRASNLTRQDWKTQTYRAKHVFLSRSHCLFYFCLFVFWGHSFYTVNWKHSLTHRSQCLFHTKVYIAQLNSVWNDLDNRPSRSPQTYFTKLSVITPLQYFLDLPNLIVKYIERPIYFTSLGCATI